MKCKTMIVTLMDGETQVFSGVEVVNKSDEGLTILTDSDYIWFDMSVVSHYKCLGYELESKPH